MRHHASDRKTSNTEHARSTGRRRRPFASAVLGATLLALPLVAACEPRPGLTVTPLDTSFSEHSIMIGSDGLPVVAYSSNDLSTLQALKVAHCEDIACTTATITEVIPDPGPGYVSGVSLAIGPDGFPLISFVNNDGDLQVAHCGDVACASATISPVLQRHSGGSRLSPTSITVGIDGLGLMTFLDYDRDWLFAAHCNDADCSSASVSIVSPNAANPGSITIGADGYGIMTFMDSDAALTAAHCQNLDCTLSDQSFVDRTQFVNGFYSSITIGTDGLPLISYLNHIGSSDSVVRVAHCNDGRCATSTLTTIGPTDDGYEPTSISIGADGLGVIAYYSGVTLRLAHCGNAACTTAGRLVAVPEDPFGRTGLYASMTIGTDGLPIIASSFYSELKVAHLSDRFGLPYHRRR